MNDLTKRLLYAMPHSLRRSILLKGMSLTYEMDPRITFKVASTKEELEGAFRLLYDAYLRVGLQKPNKQKLRVTPYHALDTTTTIVAMFGDQVIGTLSLIRFGALGLPSKDLVDYSLRRQRGLQLAEVSALAVDREFKGKIFVHLIKYMYEYSVRYMQLDELIAVIVTNRLAHLFYESVLQFRPIEGTLHKSYAFGNYQTVVAESLDLHWAKHRYWDIYGQMLPSENLYYFFGQYQCSQFQFPKRPSHFVSDPVFNGDLFKYFFMERTNVLEEMDGIAKQRLLEKWLGSGQANKQSNRAETNVHGFQVVDDLLVPVSVRNVSKEGFCLHSLDDRIRQLRNTSSEFIFRWGNGQKVRVKARQVWANAENYSGYEVLDASESSWLSLNGVEPTKKKVA